MAQNKIIITIGRQFGSGGRAIGKKLAEHLEIAYYDKELINLASQESGICGEFFEKADEKNSGSLFKALSMGFSMSNHLYQNKTYLSNESLFQIQSDAIRKVAEQNSCILVGRCADYILRDYPNSIHIFITASWKDRIRRTIEYMHFSEKEAEEFLKKADKARASYYNYYTEKVWGAAESYDLCINSSFYGIDKTVKFIEKFIGLRSMN